MILIFFQHLMKINSNGEEIWSRTVGPLTGKYELYDVVLGNGDFYTIGAREINENNHDLYRGRFDFNGNPIVEKTDIDNINIRDEIGTGNAFKTTALSPADSSWLMYWWAFCRRVQLCSELRCRNARC